MRTMFFSFSFGVPVCEVVKAEAGKCSPSVGSELVDVFDKRQWGRSRGRAKMDVTCNDICRNLPA